MSLFTFGVPRCIIEQIRSRESDTLAASMALSVTNEQGALHREWPAQSISLGDHGANTELEVGLFYRDVDVPAASPQFPDGGAISWSFLLVNASSSGTSGFLTILENAANALAGAFAGKAIEGGGNILASLVGLGLLGLQELLQVLTADCDGLVAAFSVSLTAAQLEQMTTNPTDWAQTITFPGTNSPVGCGANSKYDVVRIISDQALVAVPDIVGKSPGVARQLAEQAGFRMVEVESIGPHKTVPHVISQTPAAGNQATLELEIVAEILVPSKSVIEP